MQNIFYGDSYKAQFAIITYRLLMSKEWITYADIMAKFLNIKSIKELPYNLSNCEGYGELKKVFPTIKRIINNAIGDESFEEDGNKRAKRYRYIGNNPDPLSDMINAKTINDLKQYWRFCQDSAGFFPTSWLEYFFKDCKDLLDIKSKKQKGEQVLSSSLDRILKNIDLLPFLYESIINHQVLSILYKPYEEELQTITLHPHYLKEFNGRWYLFGHADNQAPEFGYNIALDRIVERPREIYNIKYVSAPQNFYKDFFNDIIGVSHLPNSFPIDIRLRAHTLYIFKLTETKKIHHSQNTVLPFGKHDDGEYGEFSLHIEVNNEFIGRILQMGAGLEIVSPESLRNEFKQRINQLHDLYK